MTKMNFDEALEAINDGRQVEYGDVLASALKRTVWVAEWHVPGCLSESQSYSTCKAHAIEAALDFASDSDGPPRGMKTELQRWGRSDKTCPTAYVSQATTTVSKHTLASLL
jgi:hypothetical protein